jgi:hypothetical protein
MECVHHRKFSTNHHNLASKKSIWPSYLKHPVRAKNPFWPRDGSRHVPAGFFGFFFFKEFLEFFIYLFYFLLRVFVIGGTLTIFYSLGKTLLQSKV